MEFENMSELNNDFIPLTSLGLRTEQNDIIRHLIAQVDIVATIDEFEFLIISRGLSNTIKIACRKRGLFPFFIKIGNLEEIQKEHEGFRIIRYRVNPTNLLTFENNFYEESTNLGGLMYRYVTKGRVKDMYSRLDTVSNTSDKEHINLVISIIQELFDSVLKRCHFVDVGNSKEKIKAQVNIPMLNELTKGGKLIFENDATLESSYLVERYNSIIMQSNKYFAPFGVIHGDLHLKNILIGANYCPILIDYTHVKQLDCIYKDYAKLEIHCLFQISKKISDSYYARQLFLRQYSPELLVLPRSSNDYLSALIFEIRKTLWKNCMSRDIGQSYMEIDIIYRGFLVYYLMKFYLQIENSQHNRKLALEAIINLTNSSTNEID